MEFSSLLFLYLLLPLIVLMYFLLPDVGRRNTFLLWASWGLYALCQPFYGLLLLLFCRMNHKLSFRLRGNRKKLTLALLVNLTVLFVLKYLDPVLAMAGIGATSGGLLLGIVCTVVRKINSWGMDLRVPVSLVPLGISFLMLSVISYHVDVFRGKYAPERTFRGYLLHMLLFFKLFQGPLVRYNENISELKVRKDQYRSMFDGAVRFATGLGKKVLIADVCGRMLAEMAVSGSDQALLGSWLHVVLTMFRIYYDFSGACDMAVGLGKIFGFRVPENYKLPFTAMTVTDFFAGWNLTVGRFFKDYVHDPLCSRNEGNGSKLIAGFVTVMLMCLWYGGSFNFWILGLFLAIVLFVEAEFQDFITDLPYWLRHVLTILTLMFVVVLFENRDSGEIAEALKALIGEGGAVVPGDGTRFLNSIPLIGLSWYGVTAGPKKLRFKWRVICGVQQRKDKQDLVHPVMPKAYAVSCMLYILVILWLTTAVRIAEPLMESVFMRF